MPIPRAKISAAAMLVAEEYKPLVEEALREAREELLTDEDIRDAVKAQVKRLVKELMEQKIASAARRVLADLDVDFYEVADKALRELIKK